MLDLESRMEVLGITVYRDADRSDLFYYLPADPEISRDAGGPMFDLFAYRKGGEAGQTMAGGFLTMTVDVGLGDLHDRILGKLRGLAGGDAQLTSVPYSRGTVRVIALDADTAGGGAGGGGAAGDPRFVQTIVGTGTPSLDRDNKAIFSLSLTEEGTAFFLAVLEGRANARPVGVVYELEYVGLLPAYSVDIEIDMKSSYEYLASRFSVNTLFFKADIDEATEKLRKDQSIVVKETVRVLELSTPEAIAERTRRINDLVASLCSGVLFQPTLVPGQPMASGQLLTVANQPSGTPTTGTPTTGTPTTGTPMTGTPTRPGTPTTPTTPTTPVTGTPGTPGTPVTGTPGTPGTPVTGTPTTGTPITAPVTNPSPPRPPAPPVTGRVDPPPPEGPNPTPTSGRPPQATPPATPPVQPPPPASGSGTSGTGGLQELWDKLGRPQVAYAMRSISQDEQRTISYHLDQVTAQKQTVAPQAFLQFMASQEELRQRVHVIDLEHPFYQRLKIRVDAADVDFAAQGVNQLTVELRYGTRPDGTAPKDTASAILRSHDDVKEFEFFTDEARTLSYEYRLVIDYRAGFGVGVRETHVEGPWTTTELRVLSVHPRWLDVMVPAQLQLAPNTPQDVQELQVQVRYQRPDAGVDDGELVTLTPSQRSRLVPLRLVAAGDQVTFTPTVFYTDGASEALTPQVLPNPQATDALALGVPPAGRVNGDVVLVDALGELTKVIVDLEVSQSGAVVDSRSLEVAGAAARQLWSVRLPDRDKPAAVRWRQRLAYADGGLETTDWMEAASPNLVAGIPSEGVLTVTVRYVGAAPSAAGLSGLVVQLDYADPGGDPAFAQDESLFVDDTPASRLQEWKVRLKDRAARTYTWALTALRADGSQTTTPPTPSTQSDLYVHAPGPAVVSPRPEPTPPPVPITPPIPVPVPVPDQPAPVPNP